MGRLLCVLCPLYLLVTHWWLVLVFALKINVAYFSEMLENFYKITRCHIPEDSTLQTLICMTNIKNPVLLISVQYVSNENPCGKYMFCKKHAQHDIN
jgi:hypothetical protein